MVHVSVKAEQILSIFGLSITNSMILSWIVMLLFLGIGLYYSNNLHKKKKSTLFFLLHSLFVAIHDLIKSVVREKTIVFFPLLGAYFFYILMNNWVGLLPTVGSVLIKPLVAAEVHTEEVILEKPVQTEDAHAEATKEDGHERIPLLRANTADLNTTFALALVTVIMIQYYGFKYNGVGYLKKFFNFSTPIMFFVGILELISELARILSFSFRLFGNILAGEILITIVAFLLPPVASFVMVPFFTLEIMAGAIQALVFTMLSAVLIGMATTKMHH
ncbi:F0F1 ATP synthase subunit A [Candidatus Woesebacteria bacterium]|nr:F0F1 ATP synthase subunit A [Candidatus Woesebacteria bacterium]